MDDELLGAVLGRLDRHPVPEPVSKLLLAALEGEETLHQVALGEAHPTPPQPEATSSSVQPAGAYLEALTVTGFRGIGPSTTLPLQPGPGLTVVVGRNGSGKSSFAEALELLLTGEIRRWADRSATWREGWRNLHGGQEPSIEARLTIEDAPGSSTLRRTWQPEGALESGVTTVQVAGERQQPPERLGWGEALGLYRPFLSHVELETMLRRPSDLYDVLVRLLDLDDLWDAVDRLDLVTKAARAPLAEAKRSLPGLLGELKSMDDERARGCVRALEAKDWDLDEAEGLATGIAGPTAGGELDHLRQLAQVWPPSGHEVAEAASALREAARRADAVAGTDAGRALALADLLDAALAHHRGHGDGPCPVCGRPGALEESWRSATEEQVARLRSEASAATAAKNAATAARSRVVRLLGGPPTVLERGVEGVDTGSLAQAWGEFADPPEDEGRAGLLALADHLEEGYEAVAGAAEQMRAETLKAIQEREDLWAPLASRVAAWCTEARTAQRQAEHLPDLKAAATWMSGAVDELRNERLAPLAGEAARVWAELRQESNVDLGGLRLSGSRTRRQVDFDLSVDGTGGPGLGVLSQGEVNALALSVFLPRATQAASPFRFLVIDDPVQAMDPAKVEGLARVLHRTAATRQVIVFTHDDRLPEAVRRLGLDATILEVTRRPDSVVEVRQALGPPERALEDAGAVAADGTLPDRVAPRVVGGFCRAAVEAAFTEAVRRRQLGAGRRHAEVEEELLGVRTLTQLAALAIFDDPSRGGAVLGRLNSWGGRWAADTFQALNRSAHQPHPGGLGALVADSRRLVARIRTNL